MDSAVALSTSTQHCRTHTHTHTHTHHLKHTQMHAHTHTHHLKHIASNTQKYMHSHAHTYHFKHIASHTHTHTHNMKLRKQHFLGGGRSLSRTCQHQARAPRPKGQRWPGQESWATTHGGLLSWEAVYLSQGHAIDGPPATPLVGNGHPSKELSKQPTISPGSRKPSCRDQ